MSDRRERVIRAGARVAKLRAELKEASDEFDRLLAAVGLSVPDVSKPTLTDRIRDEVDGCSSADEIAARLGANRRSVRVILSRLAAAQRIGRVARGRYIPLSITAAAALHTGLSTGARLPSRAVSVEFIDAMRQAGARDELVAALAAPSSPEPGEEGT